MDTDILIKEDLTYLEMKCKVEKEGNDEDINERLNIYDNYNVDNHDLEEMYKQTKEDNMRVEFYAYDDEGESVSMSRREIQQEYKRRKKLYVKELTKKRNTTY